MSPHPGGPDPPPTKKGGHCGGHLQCARVGVVVARTNWHASASRPSATARTFTPRIAIELTPGGAQAIPQAARPARAASYTSAWSAPRSGPTYIYECPICSKKFRRKTRDSALRPHKAPDGWNCSGRRGLLVDTVY